MSGFYKGKRTRNIFDPASDKPFKLSRSKLENFLNCPRCFYIDRRLGLGQPPGFPFNLNSAVDTLLKKEFDIYRGKEEPHPLLVENNVDAIPANHKKLNEWRENFKGVQFHHEETNLIITGAIDDLWINPAGKYIVVDYKSTSKKGEITNIDADWQISYKRQMEIYQWLLRQNGYTVSDTGYFVYCNGDTSCDRFDQKLRFDIALIAYTGNASWVEPSIEAAHQCLMSDEIPAPDEDCDYCKYIEEITNLSKPI